MTADVISSLDFDLLRSLVESRYGVVLEPAKAYLANARLIPLARKAQCNTITELMQKVRLPESKALQDQVVELLLTQETLFFRDLKPFDLLKARLLPELIRLHGTDQRLNIWCCACSTGQEPYSIAILIKEHFPMLANWNLKILATDVSPSALKTAEEGTYSQLEVNRGLPINLLMKHFQKTGINWRISEPIRAMVSFRPFNLIGDWAFATNFDIIFMRNVLIYFDLETRKKILANVRRFLNPNGAFFLGGAETTLNLDDNFEIMHHPEGVCYVPKKTTSAH